MPTKAKSPERKHTAQPIFDAHFHVIDPRFPLVPNDRYLPEPFTAQDYLEEAAPLGVVGGAVVSGSFQAFDQRYLLAALRTLGPAYVGVTQLPPSATDEEILRLDAAGVRAVRFNLRRGGSATLAELPALAARAYELAGWHAEVYVNGSDLDNLSGTLAALPKVVVDHLGLTAEGLPALLRLAEAGACVKATGFGRLDFDPAPVLRDVMAAHPGALLFGTDLPSTRAPRPFRKEDIHLVTDALGAEQARRVFFDNAQPLYRPEASLRAADS